MPISNYPNGFLNGVTIRGVPILQSHSGKVFFVNNSSVLPDNGISGSDGNDGSYLRPLSTIDAAINKCTAGRGDIIMCMPGHAETVTASSIVMDVAGVNIVGLGVGGLRPVLSFNATTSNIALSGANCSIQGVVLLSTIDSVVAGITISASGQYLDIETADTSAAIEFVSAIVTTADANNLVIKTRHRGWVAGNAMTRYIDIVGCQDALIDVDFFGIASTAVVNLRTTACDNIRVTGTFYNESAALTKNVVNSTTSTWSVQGYDAKAGQMVYASDDQAEGYDPILGYRVTKSTNLATGAGTVPAFTVSGRCLITHLSGEVTTIVGTTTTLKFTNITDSTDLCAATTITTDAVGTMYHLDGVKAAVLNAGIAPVVGSTSLANGGYQPIIVGASQNSKDISCVLDGAGTGVIAWILYYKPLASGASVVAQ